MLISTAAKLPDVADLEGERKLMCDLGGTLLWVKKTGELKCWFYSFSCRTANAGRQHQAPTHGKCWLKDGMYYKQQILYYVDTHTYIIKDWMYIPMIYKKKKKNAQGCATNERTRSDIKQSSCITCIHIRPATVQMLFYCWRFNTHSIPGSPPAY